MKTSLIEYNVTTYAGQNTLSSYSLPITPFLFIPDIENDGTYKVVWNFGDGTISKGFSATKYYEYPGVYTVDMVIYDCHNNAAVSYDSKTMHVYDYIPLSFSINGNSPLVFEIGKITQTLSFEVGYPRYQPKVSIFYDVSGSNSQSYWSIDTDKYAHLQKFNSVYQKQYNYFLKSDQYIPVKNITPTVDSIYVKLQNSQITECNNTDEGACFAGLRGTTEVYYKDDMIDDDISIMFNFDKTQMVTPFDTTNNVNLLGITLSASVVTNTPTRLAITSNGIDGEGVAINSFVIHPIKYYNTKIPFVVTSKDSENFTIKGDSTINLPSSSIQLIVGYGEVILSEEGGEELLDEYGEIIYAEQNTVILPSSSYSITPLTEYQTEGSYMGYLMFEQTQDSTLLQNVRIVVNAEVTVNTIVYNLSGESNVFNVYPSNYYDLYKYNENFDAEQTLKDLRYQETLLDCDVLFTHLLGDTLGDSNSDHFTIGKQFYEKIANFTQNTQDVDTCGVEFLDSLAQFVGYNDLMEEPHVYPLKIKRLVDLLSIDKNKLLGTTNKFNQNFDIKGRTTKEQYGTNIGDEIDPNTYVVSISSPIVALEKFSNTYSLLNTYQPLSVVNTTSYPLSDYSSEWGWPLVLPSNFDFRDIKKYYLFFEYVPTYEGSVIGGVVDYTNPMTTIPIETTDAQLTTTYGIYDNIILDTLYQSLSLIN